MQSGRRRAPRESNTPASSCSAESCKTPLQQPLLRDLTHPRLARVHDMASWAARITAAGSESAHHARGARQRKNMRAQRWRHTVYLFHGRRLGRGARLAVAAPGRRAGFGRPGARRGGRIVAHGARQLGASSSFSRLARLACSAAAPARGAAQLATPRRTRTPPWVATHPPPALSRARRAASQRALLSDYTRQPQRLPPARMSVAAARRSSAPRAHPGGDQHVPLVVRLSLGGRATRGRRRRFLMVQRLNGHPVQRSGWMKQ